MTTQPESVRPIPRIDFSDLAELRLNAGNCCDPQWVLREQATYLAKPRRAKVISTGRDGRSVREVTVLGIVQSDKPQNGSIVFDGDEIDGHGPAFANRWALADQGAWEEFLSAKKKAVRTPN